MKPATLSAWDMLDAIADDERVICSSVLDDPADTMQRIRAAGLTWQDFVYDLHQDVVRAGFACEDVPGVFAMPYGRRWRFMQRAVLEIGQGVDAAELARLAADRYHAADLSAAIGRLVRTARARRVADQHLAAYRRAMGAAYRVATEHQHERLQAAAEVDRTLRLMADAKRKRLPAARDVRRDRPLPGMAGRSDHAGRDRVGVPGRMDAKDPVVGARKLAG